MVPPGGAKTSRVSRIIQHEQISLHVHHFPRADASLKTTYPMTPVKTCGAARARGSGARSPNGQHVELVAAHLPSPAQGDDETHNRVQRRTGSLWFAAPCR
jgi:hypothetical protein